MEKEFALMDGMVEVEVLIIQLAARAARHQGRTKKISYFPKLRASDAPGTWAVGPRLMQGQHATNTE